MHAIGHAVAALSAPLEPRLGSHVGLDLHTLVHRLIDVFLLVVSLVQHDARQSGIDPAGPLVEPRVYGLALSVQEVAIDCLHAFATRVAQLEREDTHLEELTLWILARRLLAAPLQRECGNAAVSETVVARRQAQVLFIPPDAGTGDPS